MPKIDIECPSCHGTGLYKGFAEPKGTAVVCLGCEGSGHTEYEYRAFTKRKEKPGIERVARSAGSFLATGMGPEGRTISYEEFKRGKLPP